MPDSGLVTDVNVLGLNGTHTYINDLIFTLISPAAAQTLLMNRACGSQDNFNLSFDDESPNAAGTWPCPPTNGGTYRPAGSLSDLRRQPDAGDLDAEGAGRGRPTTAAA